MSEANKHALQQANAAIVRGDFEGFLKFCTEDTTWNFMGDRTLTGKAAVREWMKTAYVQPPQFDVHHLVAEGDFVTAIGEITTHDDQGRAVHNAYCDVWRFRGPLMASLQAFVVPTGQQASAA